MSTTPKRGRGFRTIITAGLVVGMLDITSAFVIWWTRNTPPTRGLQGIASALLGARAAEGGLATAGLGLAIHFFIAFVVVTVFYLASRRILFLTQHVVLSGVLYGVAVYLVMYWLVLPTAFPKFQHRPGNDLLAIAIHITLIGLPTALVVRQNSRKSTEQLT
jgi:hypothetical protein